MLLALLLGMALNLFGHEELTVPDIAFSREKVLKICVVRLGARISVGELAEIGVVPLVSVALAVVATIKAGVLIVRWLG